MELTFGPPNASIYSFNGELRIYDQLFRSSPSPCEAQVKLLASADFKVHEESKNLLDLPPVKSEKAFKSRGYSSSKKLQLGNKPGDPYNTPAVYFTRRTVKVAPPCPASSPDGPFEGIPFVALSLDINQFLWRGATLQNTDWIYGVVVYAGHQTRIFKNSRSRVLKYSRLLKTYNKHAIFLACTQVSRTMGRMERKELCTGYIIFFCSLSYV